MKKFFIIAILVLAAVLRFWNLGTVPPSPSLDEASIGYNAYSVLHIGVDEYGNFPLISQRGYDDYRRSTYLFLTIPFIALLNLQVIAVRLPAVFLSLFTILAMYKISALLFLKPSKLTAIIPAVAALLLAISPWHTYISRLGHESNAYLSFFVLGLLFFLIGIRSKNYLFLSFVFFTLSMISYYAGQVFIPLFILGALSIYRKSLLSMVALDKKILIPFIICAILVIPVIWAIFSPTALIRFQGTSTFTPQAHPQKFTEMVTLRNKAIENHDIVGSILYNRRLFPVQVFVEGYLSHFDPWWLFANSLDEPFKAPGMGLLYIWEIPFIVIGIVVFLFGRAVDPRAKKLIFLWLFLSPFPGAIATQAPHAMRAYTLAPVLQLFTAFGLVYAWSILRNYKKFGLIAFGGILLVSIFAVYKNYFTVFPVEQSGSFQYALAKAIPFVAQQEGSYKKVVFSNENNLYQSYMFFLYFNRYSPSLYQEQGGTKSGGFAEVHAFGKYEFRPIHWGSEKVKGTLYIGNVSDFPPDIPAVATFTLLDGKEAVKAVSL